MATRLREVEEKSDTAVREAGEKLSKATSELTTLRHQSMWNEREGGIKQSALVRELDSLRDTVQVRSGERCYLPCSEHSCR